MTDVSPFAGITVIVALGLMAAVMSNRLSDRFAVPTPAIFLLVAAAASDLVPYLGSLSIRVDQRIVTVALVVILFDGGMTIGWRRFRSDAVLVVWLGVMGTIVTALTVASAAHLVFGYSWQVALLIGTALAPTDPAVVFSVLGRRELSGRSATVLKGESGANDPVGIALMISLLSATGSGWGGVLGGVGDFALQMAVGALMGVVGARVLVYLLRHVRLPNDALYPIQTIAFTLLVYGITTVCLGSGFLAVFLMGILTGDARAPFKRETEHFVSALGTLGEIVAFTILGLSVSLHDVVTTHQLLIGMALAAFLILLARPVLVGALILRSRLSAGERAFVLWAGLKGAVPILLGTYVLRDGSPDAHEVYDLIFIVVTVSVVVQGGLVPVVARVAGIPMRRVEPAPWALGMRFREEPDGLHRYIVEAGSPAEGSRIDRLATNDTVWVSMVSRNGVLVPPRGATTLQAGDEVLALTDDDPAIGRVFQASPSP
jgi:cell volume regulation protein A